MVTISPVPVASDIEHPLIVSSNFLKLVNAGMSAVSV